MRKFLGCLVVLVVVLGLIPVLASANEVSVYDTSGTLLGTYTTIQAGVDACPEDGTVSVSAGTYTETVFINKHIALIGVGTPTIDTSTLGDTTTVTFDGTDALIFGFKIIGAIGYDYKSKGIYCNNSSPFIINNTILRNKYGIYSSEGSSPTITNNTISGNSSYGIYCSQGTPVITNNTISKNNWMGIYCSRGSPTITNNTISGHSDGIYCDFSSSTITNNTISENHKSIFCENSSSVNITNNIILNSGISCVFSSVTITNNTISKTHWYGISCKSSYVNITNNTISRNHNGGIYCDSSTLTITNNTISGNSGGGIFCKDFFPSTITNNIISGNWGGISCSNGTPTITNNTISGNRGGGISCVKGFPIITNNTISGNTGGTREGNGIGCYDSFSGIITNNTISGNDGQGISCSSFLGTIVNNTISRNKYNGISCYSYSSPNIINNTISGNGRHGIRCDSSSPKIYNNIITENGTISAGYYGIYVDSGNSTIAYNNVWRNGLTRNNNYYGCYANLHDISSDPQFIGNGNYRLASISLCIDAGSNTVPGIPLTDKDGNLRIINGTVDIGAYEYQNIPSFTGSISGTVTDTLGNPISGALVKVTSGNLTKALSTRGEVITGTDGTFTITNLPFGTYTLRASFSGYHHSYRKVVVFSSISGVVITMLSTSTTLLYVAATNTSGIENGSSDTPYSVIQMGVDTAINGNTIKVGSGLYRGGIFINRQIRVIGAGEDITIIDGGVGFSGNFDSNYSIEGFKITGGNKGIYCNNANPTITNNTISGNSWGIYCKDSAFPNITNNIILGNSLYGIFCIFSSVTITNNIISRSRWDGISCYSSSGTIYNNIITENGTTSNYYYYGIYQSNSNLTIDYNCVWGNGLNGNRNYFGCNPGFNDICLDPQFTSDFYLKQTSPCIDAGDNSAPGLPLTDKDGTPI